MAEQTIRCSQKYLDQLKTKGLVLVQNVPKSRVLAQFWHSEQKTGREEIKNGLE